MSCNGCRVLRKGCSQNCTLRPCLQWIKSPESQANATLFLAKFYGRAGLINLINAAPTHLHPEIFRSLLYEACGRIINPVHGSVGLMCSGNWPRWCHGKGGSNSPVLTIRLRILRAAIFATSPRISSTQPPPHQTRNRFKSTATHAKLTPSLPILVMTLANRNEQPALRVKPEELTSEIGLDLTLGMNPGLQAYMSTVIEISDSET
ncbi:UNVERIFIED_CONTAM: LOB domain-containing protein 40 [Sesamum radiatum]|uniref:LOB domain-containing protein 40 n=1 Tax=Sesamum radiatum TaxID=300843 RepID=A0AAW2VMZ8_SESRA